MTAKTIKNRDSAGQRIPEETAKWDYRPAYQR